MLRFLSSFRRFKQILFNPSRIIHPAAQQKTPYNLNRYVLLLVYIIYTFLSSCTYFGWRSVSHMLIKSKAYEWLCSNNKTTDAELNDRFMCNEQDLSVQQLFTIAMACHFFMSAVSGALMDFISPKIVAIFGQILNLIGWLILAFCSSSFRAYIPAFVFIGAGADTGFLPTLKLANLFPTSSAICTTILGAAVSASFSIPLIMDTIWTYNENISFFSLCVGYMLCGPVLCGFIALLVFPYKPFKEEIELAQLVEASPSSEEAKVQDKTFASGFGDAENEQEDLMCAKSAYEDGSKSNSEALEDIILDMPKSSKEGASGILSNEDGSNARNVASSFDLLMKSNANSNGSALAAKDIKQEKNLVKILLSKHYVVICVYFILCSVSMVYYQEAASRLFSAQVENVLSALMPFSFIPCILIGKMIDVYGIAIIIVFINVLGASMYFFVCFNFAVLHYLSVTLYVTYISVYTSQLYCYISYTFASCHFGKLLGLASCAGGFLSLVTHYIYEGVTINLMRGSSILMNVIFSVLLVFQTLVLIYVFFMKRKFKT